MRRKKIFVYAGAIIFVALGTTTLIMYKKIRTACSRPTHLKYKNKILNKSSFLKKYNIHQITLKTKDNINLSTYLIERPNAKRVFLICHGRWQAKEFLHYLLDIFDKDTILLFDFRSHGSSTGDLITMGLTEAIDINTAVSFLKNYKNTQQLPIIGLGFSMGGASLVKAASQNNSFNAVILDSIYARLGKQLGKEFTEATKLPEYFFGFGKYIFELIIGTRVEKIDPINFIGSIKAPIMIIHAKNDTVVPIDDAYELFDKIQSKKELWLVDDAKHARIYKKYPQEYKNNVLKFLDGAFE